MKKNNNYKNNNQINTDYDSIFNKITNKNKFNHDNHSDYKNQEDNNENKIISENKNENNFLKNIISKIKNKLAINDENNQELIFKELKNKFESNNNINNNYNHQNIGSNKSYVTNDGKNSFHEKFSLNKFLNQYFLNKINLKIAIPLIVAILAILAICVVLSFIFLGFEIALAIILIVLIVLSLILYFPQMEKKKKYSEISKELPFALRHMVTELKSGKGLHDTLNSIAIHDYGALSEEFSRVLEEIKYGENTETALVNMSKRVSSNGLERTVQQIIGTLRTGGNLSNTLSIIAEDITHELQMKLKDYSQKLNAFIKHYRELYKL